jgi:hypothetical protein
LATLLFSLAQAGSAYAMSFAFAQSGSYRSLYAAGGLVEAFGMLCCLGAMLASRRRS